MFFCFSFSIRSAAAAAAASDTSMLWATITILIAPPPHHSLIFAFAVDCSIFFKTTDVTAVCQSTDAPAPHSSSCSDHYNGFHFHPIQIDFSLRWRHCRQANSPPPCSESGSSQGSGSSGLMIAVTSSSRLYATRPIGGIDLSLSLIDSATASAGRKEGSWWAAEVMRVKPSVKSFFVYDALVASAGGV